MCLTSSQLFSGRKKMKSQDHLQKVESIKDSQTKYLVQQKDGSKEKATFKIRVNSFHRVKLDHSLYNP